MTTREEQIASAERIAALNPEWIWDAHYLDFHRAAGPEVVWLTARGEWRCLKSVRDVPAVRFRSAAEAFRFLGIPIIIEQEP